MSKEVDNMKEILEKIVKENKSLLGENPSITRINTGFTNTIYNINNKFILKICTQKENEEKFIKEVNFYKANKENELIPRLYISNTKKDKIPYMYEIIEKIEGNTLYDVWHTLSETTREEIIKQLCEAMKEFHKNKGPVMDWNKKTSELYTNLLNKAKKMNIFSKDELKLLDQAYKRFPELLESNEFVLVHNDLHFDNIIYHKGTIKLIDFERSIYAPKDFELDILYRMIRKPWKFANEENEKYTKLSDYENIMTYIEKYYPEIIQTNHLYERLAIYDMVYYLKHAIKNPSLEELKIDILKAAKIVLNNI